MQIVERMAIFSHKNTGKFELNCRIDVSEKMFSVQHKIRISASHRSVSGWCEICGALYTVCRCWKGKWTFSMLHKLKLCNVRVYTSISHFIGIDGKLSRQWEWEAGQTTHIECVCVYICTADVSISHDMIIVKLNMTLPSENTLCVQLIVIYLEHHEIVEGSNSCETIWKLISIQLWAQNVHFTRDNSIRFDLETNISLSFLRCRGCDYEQHKWEDSIGIEMPYLFLLLNRIWYSWSKIQSIKC